MIYRGVVFCSIFGKMRDTPWVHNKRYLLENPGEK